MASGKPATREHVQTHLDEARYLLGQLPLESLVVVVEQIVAASLDGGDVLIIGNGGSAATANHFATDLSNAGARGGVAVRARSLTDNTALFSAIANDDGYEQVFAEQMRRYSSAGDVLIAISGSGNSLNILAAVRAAKEAGLYVIGFVGFGGGRLSSLCDVAAVIDASSIQLVEDAHGVMCHAIALAVEARFASRVSKRPLRPAIFVDRDGVINERRQNHVKSWEDFRFLPDAVTALVRLSRSGIAVVVVTNQAVIGRDGVPAETIDEIHARMIEEIGRAGGSIAGVYVCPHAPYESCRCRKPRPGLLCRAAEELSLDLRSSVLIGDSLSDIIAAHAVGSAAILLGTGSTKGLADLAVLQTGGLSEAADIALQHVRRGGPAEPSRPAAHMRIDRG